MLPKEVHKSDRKIAWFVYFVLLGIFFASITITINSAVASQSSPPYSITIEDTRWSLPHISLCPMNVSVGSTANHDHNMINSMTYDYINTHFYHPDVTDEGTKYKITTRPDPISPKKCALIETGGMVPIYKDNVNQFYIGFQFKDIATLSPPNQFILYGCEIRFYDNELDESEWVPQTLSYIPYGPTNQTWANSIHLAKSENRAIDGEVTSQFTASLSSIPGINFYTEFNGCVNSSNSNCYDDLPELTQHASFLFLLSGWQVTVYQEIDPLDYVNLMGVFGGFYGYVVIIFGVFFGVTDIEANKVGRWRQIQKAGELVAQSIDSKVHISPNQQLLPGPKIVSTSYQDVIPSSLLNPDLPILKSLSSSFRKKRGGIRSSWDENGEMLEEEEKVMDLSNSSPTDMISFASRFVVISHNAFNSSISLTGDQYQVMSCYFLQFGDELLFERFISLKRQDSLLFVVCWIVFMENHQHEKQSSNSSSLSSALFEKNKIHEYMSCNKILERMIKKRLSLDPQPRFIKWNVQVSHCNKDNMLEGEEEENSSDSEEEKDSHDHNDRKSWNITFMEENASIVKNDGSMRRRTSESPVFPYQSPIYLPRNNSNDQVDSPQNNNVKFKDEYYDEEGMELGLLKKK